MPNRLELFLTELYIRFILFPKFIEERFMWIRDLLFFINSDRFQQTFSSSYGSGSIDCCLDLVFANVNSSFSSSSFILTSQCWNIGSLKLPPMMLLLRFKFVMNLFSFRKSVTLTSYFEMRLMFDMSRIWRLLLSFISLIS